MALDFSKLASPKQIVVPVLNNFFQYNNKKYATKNLESGWYLVTIKNNEILAAEPYSGEFKYDYALGYTYNNMIIFQNFDVAKRKWGFNLQVDLNFNTAETFSTIKAVVWEDKRVYYTEPNYSDYRMYEVKDIYDKEEPIADAKGITPELRTLFLFHSIERENFRIFQAKQMAAEEHQKRMQELPYRLQHQCSYAGAELLNYKVEGFKIIIDWKLPGSNYRYNSEIDSRTFMTINAGYCMSGGDKIHNLTSLIKTAEEYEERGVVHITRGRDWS